MRNRASDTQQLVILRAPRRWHGDHRNPRRWLALASRLGIGVFAAFIAVTGMRVAFADEATPTAAAPNSGRPTLTITSSINLLGLLNGVAVQPANVSIPAGEAVDIVNRSIATMNVTIAGEQVSIPPSQAAGIRLIGGAQPTRHTVSATPINVPILGDLIASSATVAVAAQQTSSPSTPPSTSDPAPKPGTSPGVTNPNQSTQQPSSPGNTSQTRPDAATTQPPTGDGGAAEPIDPLATSISRQRQYYAQHATGSDEDLKAIGYSTSKPFPDWLGLVVAVAAVVLVGLASAAARAASVKWRAAR